VATVPCAEMVRFTISGTETTWYAVRLARQYTGRKKILKFEGHFHGFNDYLQFNYWPPLSEAWPNVHEEAFGGPTDMRPHVIVLPFNDPQLLAETLAQHGSEIAAIIMEPLNYNSCGIRPQPGYLQCVRDLCTQYGIVLIFDEILSGFRTGPGCIQAYYGVTPDLCTIGKAMAGGLPLSAYAGKAQIMQHVAPLGPAMHSGTYNANLVSIMAANAFFDVIGETSFYPDLLRRSGHLYEQINAIFNRVGLGARVQGTGARFSLLFGAASQREMVNYRDAALQDWPLAYRFFGACLDHGVYFHTMQHHGLSAAHTDADVARVLEGVEAAARDVVAMPPIEASQEVFAL
jgi:glutamate-1-semialdehyde 2,1-aminomutase